jgi:hypothetical protein
MLNAGMTPPLHLGHLRLMPDVIARLELPGFGN